MFDLGQDQNFLTEALVAPPPLLPEEELREGADPLEEDLPELPEFTDPPSEPLLLPPLKMSLRKLPEERLPELELEPDLVEVLFPLYPIPFGLLFFAGLVYTFILEVRGAV